MSEAHTPPQKKDVFRRLFLLWEGFEAWEGVARLRNNPVDCL